MRQECYRCGSPDVMYLLNPNKTPCCDKCFDISRGSTHEQKEKPQEKSVLREAEEIISGERRAAYGDAAESFRKIAEGWSSIANAPITPRKVALMMVWLKVCRDANKPGRDSLVDICGYAALADKL